MITFEEAFMLFGKWIEEETPIRFDGGKSLLYSFSLAGALESANPEIVCLRVRDFGYIEVHFPPGTGFDYFDPNAMRVEESARIGKGYQNESVIYGAGLIAIKKTGETFRFFEIVKDFPE